MVSVDGTRGIPGWLELMEESASQTLVARATHLAFHPPPFSCISRHTQTTQNTPTQGVCPGE